MKKIKIMYVLITAVFLSTILFGWGEPTHEKMTNLAYPNSVLKKKTYKTGYLNRNLFIRLNKKCAGNYLHEPKSTVEEKQTEKFVCDWLVYGSRSEDAQLECWRGPYYFQNNNRSYHHFYNPFWWSPVYYWGSQEYVGAPEGFVERTRAQQGGLYDTFAEREWRRRDLFGGNIELVYKYGPNVYNGFPAMNWAINGFNDICPPRGND
jgi:hypothetical protein